MSPTNRSTVRQGLATLLGLHVTSAQAIYAYQADDFQGQSPVLCITSAASQRERLTLGDTRGQATFAVDVHTFVLYRDKDNPETWGPEQAEEQLDELEQQVASVIFAHKRTEAWQSIAYAEPSEARDTVIIGGVAYLHEVIPVAMRAY